MNRYTMLASASGWLMFGTAMGWWIIIIPCYLVVAVCVWKILYDILKEGSK